MVDSEEIICLPKNGQFNQILMYKNMIKWKINK